MNNTKTNQTCQLLSAMQLAKMLAVSPRTVFRLRASRKIPAPVMVGGSPRWEQGTIEKWIRMGCPDLKEFELFKDMVAGGE